MRSKTDPTKSRPAGLPNWPSTAWTDYSGASSLVRSMVRAPVAPEGWVVSQFGVVQGGGHPVASRALYGLLIVLICGIAFSDLNPQGFWCSAQHNRTSRHCTVTEPSAVSLPEDVVVRYHAVNVYRFLGFPVGEDLSSLLFREGYDDKLYLRVRFLRIHNSGLLIPLWVRQNRGICKWIWEDVQAGFYVASKGGGLPVVGRFEPDNHGLIAVADLCYFCRTYPDIGSQLLGGHFFCGSPLHIREDGSSSGDDDRYDSQDEWPASLARRRFIIALVFALLLLPALLTAVTLGRNGHDILGDIVVIVETVLMFSSYVLLALTYYFSRSWRWPI